MTMPGSGAGESLYFVTPFSGFLRPKKHGFPPCFRRSGRKNFAFSAFAVTFVLQASPATIRSASANSAGSTTAPEAAALSVTWLGRLAPVIAEATLGPRRAPARAHWGRG